MIQLYGRDYQVGKLVFKFLYNVCSQPVLQHNNITMKNPLPNTIVMVLESFKRIKRKYVKG